MKEYIEKLDALECVKYTPIASAGAVEEEFIDAWVDGTSDATRAIYKSITSLPTADVVEVVRCKDCKHWQGATYRHGRCVCERLSRWSWPSDYCEQGERRADHECET